MREQFHDQQEVVSYYIQFGYTLLAQTKGGIIAGIGVAVLLVTVMRLFSNIEEALNYMCGVRVGRTILRKASDYLALILICPILLVASSSITVFLTTNIQKLTEPGARAEEFGTIALTLIHAIPYLMSTILFTLVYIVMPNTKVRFLPALCAGAFAGCTYQILQATYISIQIKVSNAGAIYGSFAALPLFLVWLYVSWLLFLIGAQVMVLFEERMWDPKMLVPYRKLSLFERQLVGIALVKVSVDYFLRGKPATLKELSNLLHMPERDLSELVDDLIQVGLIYKIIAEDGSSFAIVPAQNPDTMSLLSVMVDAQGTNALTSAPILCFEELVKSAEAELVNSKKNPRLVDIKYKR